MIDADCPVGVRSTAPSQGGGAADAVAGTTSAPSVAHRATVRVILTSPMEAWL
jgi:hypothetical protein